MDDGKTEAGFIYLFSVWKLKLVTLDDMKKAFDSQPQTKYKKANFPPKVNVQQLELSEKEYLFTHYVLKLLKQFLKNEITITVIHTLK